MSEFNRGGGRSRGGSGGGFKKPWSGGGGDRGGRGGFGGGFGGDKRPVTLHDATCGECGNACQVPFRPSSDRPVLCTNCFSSKKASMGGDRGSERGSDMGSRERYVSTPRTDRPAPMMQNNDESKKQFADIMTKLDKLTSILEASFAKKETAKEIVKEVAVEKKAEVKSVKVEKAETKVVKAKKPAVKVVAKKKK